MSPQVAAIITTKNNKNIIEECLASIFNQTHRNIHCILADDGSTDGTVEFVKERFPQVEIVINPKSEGPAKNRNLGLARTTAPYVLFMDSDASIAPDWLEKALEFLENRLDIGALAGKIFNADKTLQATQSFFHITGVCGFDSKAEKNLAEYLWWPTSTLLARTEVVKKVGGFNETFCYPLEDSDLCLKIWQAGSKLVYNNELHSVHKESATVGVEIRKKKVMFMKKRNKMVTALANFEIWTLIKYSPMILGFCLVELLVLPYKKEVLLGNLAGLFAVPHIIDRRKKIKEYKKVPDSVLLGDKISTSISDFLKYGLPKR